MITTTAEDGGTGSIDVEAEERQQRERRRQQERQPRLSSLLLSSIREEEGGKDNDDNEIDPDDPRRHHRVMHAVLDTTMQVMNYLEAEIDANTWNNLDEFVPMQLRLAIEDQVFGWDHFHSSILGHMGYTLGSYLATYWLVTFVVLRRVPWDRGGGRRRRRQHRASAVGDAVRIIRLPPRRAGVRIGDIHLPYHPTSSTGLAPTSRPILSSFSSSAASTFRSSFHMGDR